LTRGVVVNLTEDGVVGQHASILSCPYVQVLGSKDGKCMSTDQLTVQVCLDPMCSELGNPRCNWTRRLRVLGEPQGGDMSTTCSLSACTITRRPTSALQNTAKHTKDHDGRADSVPRNGSRAELSTVQLGSVLIAMNTHGPSQSPSIQVHEPYAIVESTYSIQDT
jgi:hypothetical protein